MQCQAHALLATIRNTTDSVLFKRLLKYHFNNRFFDITAYVLLIL